MEKKTRIYAGKPAKFEVDATGLAPGSTVSFEIYEHFGLGGDPVDKVTATVSADDPHCIKAQWTYDHKKLKDKVSGSTFYLICRGGETAISIACIEVVQKFETTVKDSAGHPLANHRVILRSPRGPRIEATSDAQGKVKADVPPGDYRIEVEGPAAPPPPAPPAAPARKRPQLGVITATVVDHRGRPLAGWRWKLELPDGSTREGDVPGDGVLTLRDVPPGAAKLKLTAPSSSSGSSGSHS